MYMFIEPEQTFEPETRQPASYVRKRVIISKAVAAAQLEMTALGVYIGYFNGERLTEGSGAIDKAERPERGG